jgi:hypothetical protein
MSTFHLESTLDTSINYFSPESEPVLTVAPGDTVVVHSLDASGYTERQRTPGEAVPTLFERGKGHCLVGPIAVDGALPGQVLAVHLTSLRPDEWGWTASAAIDNPLNRALGSCDRHEPAGTLGRAGAFPRGHRAAAGRAGQALHRAAAHRRRWQHRLP